MRTPTENEQADWFVVLVRDVLTIDQLVSASQQAHVLGKGSLREELHHWLGARYADKRALEAVGLPTQSVDVPFKSEPAS